MPARPQLPLVSVKKNHDGESSGGVRERAEGFAHTLSSMDEYL